MSEAAEASVSGPIAEASTEELAEALRKVIGEGLPVAQEAAVPLLLNLRSVYARSVVPSDPASRLTALNELLPRLIATLSDGQYREATQVLFGLAPGTRGTKLMPRRRQAADLLGYNADYFRTDIEAKILHAAALAVNNDLLRYRSRVKRAMESLEPTGDTPSLGPESLTAEEELVSRIWQNVYGLRAELIAFLRLSEHDVDGQSLAEDHRQAALGFEEQIHRLADEYVETFGQDLVRHGDSEYSLEALKRLSGWQL